ncbi:MAG: hypothetical protein NTW10_04115 [Bacteroidetes bacterium]|nr:hypothetical protein [Bacteroidota bacterium]
MKTNTHMVVKFFLSFLIFFGWAVMIHCQTITFRVTNPKIGTGGGIDSLEFNVEVKSTVAHYADALQANFYYTIAAFGHYSSPPIGAVSLYGTGITGTGKYQLTATLQSDHINVSAAATHVFLPGDNLATYYELVGTSWTTLFKVRVKIFDNMVTSGIYFYPTFMTQPKNQLYVDPTLGQGQKWGSVSLDETKSLQTLYLGRVFCGTYGWSQVGGTVNWSASSINTSVWDTTTVPASITGTNCLVNNLRIHPYARLKIAPGGELKVSTGGITEITEPFGLWIVSDVTGTGAFMDDGETSITYNGSASIRIQRWVGQNNWHIIGFPIHTVMPQATFLNTYLKWYDESRAVPIAERIKKYRYVINPLPAADSAIVTQDLRGWFHWASSSLTPTYNTVNFNASSGNHLVSGSQTRTLTRTISTDGIYDGWNMVANMYPCPLDWRAVSGWTKTNIDPTIYFWSQPLDIGSGNYASYNGSTQVSTNGGTQYIPSLQGFFVHVTDPQTSGTLGMDNNVKVFSSQAFWKEQITYTDLLDLVAESNGSKDETKVWFNSSATVNFDPEYDNYKLFGDDGIPQFYSLLADNNYAAVNTLPWGGLNTVIPMGFILKADTTVTITASNMESFKSGTRIYLEDIKDGGSMHELTVNPIYTFTASPNDDHDRFVLHFYNPSFGIEDKSFTGMQIYSFEDYVYVMNLVTGTTKGTCVIFDLLGRKVFEANLRDMNLNKFLPGVNEGYYMVRVVTPENLYSQKVYLK